MSRDFTSTWLATYEARNAPKIRSGASEDAVEREMDLHGHIMDYCQCRGWKYVRSNPAKPTTCGEGVADFIIYADKGRMFNIECKARSGKLSLEQQAFIAWLAKLGHVVHVVRNMTEFTGVVG